jgi:outer membrane protein OmpA-like peptidoglycan-associated protein
LEIIEVTDFEPTLEVVKAEEMSAKITEKGHIALYGIYFDTGNDALKPDSDPVLQEIAKTLNTDPGLKLYVVGHTDNEGALEYNQDLSKRRAASVIRALTSKLGVANERLMPIGVGLAAPVSTNDTEEGRALNRRVELVKR